jgi:hypothetical protein
MNRARSTPVIPRVEDFVAACIRQNRSGRRKTPRAETNRKKTPMTSRIITNILFNKRPSLQIFGIGYGSHKDE